MVYGVPDRCSACLQGKALLTVQWWFVSLEGPWCLYHPLASQPVLSYFQVLFHGFIHFATHFSAFQEFLLHTGHHVPAMTLNLLESSVVPSHINSAWTLQETWRVWPGLSNKGDMPPGYMSVVKNVTPLLLLSKTHFELWMPSFDLRAYMFLVLFTTYSRNTCHHTSIKVLAPALKWVLEFPMALLVCDFLPWNDLEHGAVNPGSCSAPSLVQGFEVLAIFCF